MEDLRGGATLKPVALVRALEVVEAKIAVEVALHRGDADVVGAAEGATPQFGEDGALQTLDEAVGPGMAGAGAPMRNRERGAGVIKLPIGTRSPRPSAPR